MDSASFLDYVSLIFCLQCRRICSFPDIDAARKSKDGAQMTVT